jgi:hypothetical protein
MAFYRKRVGIETLTQAEEQYWRNQNVNYRPILASSGNTYNATGVVAIGHALADSGTSDTTHKMNTLNMTLIDNEETTWVKDSTITLAVKYASVESAGSFGLPQAFTSASWDDSCRITVVLELDDMQSWDDEAGNRRTWLY